MGGGAAIGKGGGKSFFVKTRFPPGRQGKWVEVRIGKYGKGVGRMSLKQARDEWRVIRAWSQENGKDPRDRKREAKYAREEQATLTTFEQACEAYLTWSGANEKGRRNTGTSLNQVLPEFGAETPIEHLSWDYQRLGRPVGSGLWSSSARPETEHPQLPRRPSA